MKPEFCQVWLISYVNSLGGVGRFFNYRLDNKPPSMANIISMESKLSNKEMRGVTTTITSVSKIDDIAISELTDKEKEGLFEGTIYE